MKYILSIKLYELNEHISHNKTGMTERLCGFLSHKCYLCSKQKEVKKDVENNRNFSISKLATKEGVPEWPLTDKSKRGGKINEYRGNYGIKNVSKFIKHSKLIIQKGNKQTK